MTPFFVLFQLVISALGFMGDSLSGDFLAYFWDSGGPITAFPEGRYKNYFFQKTDTDRWDIDYDALDSLIGFTKHNCPDTPPASFGFHINRVNDIYTITEIISPSIVSPEDHSFPYVPPFEVPPKDDDYPYTLNSKWALPDNNTQSYLRLEFFSEGVAEVCSHLNPETSTHTTGNSYSLTYYKQIIFEEDLSPDFIGITFTKEGDEWVHSGSSLLLYVDDEQDFLVDAPIRRLSSDFLSSPAPLRLLAPQPSASSSFWSSVLSYLGFNSAAKPTTEEGKFLSSSSDSSSPSDVIIAANERPPSARESAQLATVTTTTLGSSGGTPSAFVQAMGLSLISHYVTQVGSFINSNSLLGTVSKEVGADVLAQSLASLSLLTTAFGVGASEKMTSQDKLFTTAQNITLRYQVLGTGPKKLVFTASGQDSFTKDPFPVALLSSDPNWTDKYTVLLHDRRNTGASDIVYLESEQDTPEPYLHVRDLHELMTSLNHFPAVMCGTSAGSRLSLLFAKSYPSYVDGLVIRNPSGGTMAAELLTAQYYTQYSKIIDREAANISILSRTSHYDSMVSLRPANTQNLLKIRPAVFLKHMETNASYLKNSRTFPTLGITEEELQGIGSRALVVHCQVPEDGIHLMSVAESVNRLLKSSSLVKGAYSDRFDDINGWVYKSKSFIDA